MRLNKQLTSRLAVGLAVATLVGTSAFAESRPSNETRGGRSTVRRERAAVRSEARRGNNSSNRSINRQAGERRQQRSYDRNRGESRSRSRSRSYDRDRSSRSRQHTWRGDSRSYYNGGRSFYNRQPGTTRQPYYTRGRVSRIDSFRSGYRVWIGGAPYPFFIPSAYYHRNRFRVGLVIGLGGYYNPLGYYDYYGGDRYYNDRAYSRAELRGIVESVDDRRDTFVVRNEATGSFVTVEMRDRRRDVRPGDYVEIDGEWMRSGLFRAYDVELLDPEYRR